jgi:hypothetical protein
MLMLNRSIKILITISLFSLLFWITYWLIPSFYHFNNLILGLPDQYSNKEWYFIPAHFGLVARFIGTCLGLLTTFFIWVKNKPFSKVKNMITTSLLMEATYSISLLPSFWSLFSTFRATTLGIAYFLQIIFTTPLLVILALKIYQYNTHENKLKILKWSNITFAGYIAALWINSMFRWIDMLLSEGFSFLISGIRAIGFFDAAVFMSLAVIFAAIGARSHGNQIEAAARRWIGLTMVMIGLHYVIYLVYSYIVDSLGFALLVDVWTVPLLFLGLALLFAKPSEQKRSF